MWDSRATNIWHKVLCCRMVQCNIFFFYLRVAFIHSFPSFSFQFISTLLLSHFILCLQFEEQFFFLHGYLHVTFITSVRGTPRTSFLWPKNRFYDHGCHNIMVTYLIWFQCFPYRLKNMEISRLGLESMHVTAKLTVFLGLSVQEVHFCIYHSFMICCLGQAVEWKGRCWAIVFMDCSLAVRKYCA
jgi:hypothetical protein